MRLVCIAWIICISICCRSSFAQTTAAPNALGPPVWVIFDTGKRNVETLERNAAVTRLMLHGVSTSDEQLEKLIQKGRVSRSFYTDGPPPVSGVAFCSDGHGGLTRVNFRACGSLEEFTKRVDAEVARREAKGGGVKREGTATHVVLRGGPSRVAAGGAIMRMSEA